VDNLFQDKESIFTEEVSNFDLPGRFKVPEISLFSSSEDPVEHLDNFRSHVSLHKTLDAVACRAFPLTLSGKARDWLRNLTQGQLIISTPLEGSSWPSLCPGGPEGNPEGIYSPYNRDQTNL
jgi:hypothetical protein